MAIAKRTRKQIEKHITTCAESIQSNGLEIGRALIEIRDDELWADEFDSWNQYLKERAAELVGRSFAQSAKLIIAAEIEKRISRKAVSSTIQLSATALTELGRLAPNTGSNASGSEKDYSKLRKKDVASVIKAAGPEPTVRDIRAAVDDYVGFDRKAEAAKSKAKKEQESQIDLDDYLSRIKGTSEGWLQVLEAVPADAWHDYASGIDETAKALELLSKFLRS